MQAIVLREYGPPENLKWETLPDPEPQKGEALLRVRAVSVDLFQMEFRSGRALQIPLPRIIGNGPAGEIARLGPEVSGFSVGQRVVVCNNISCGNCKYCRMGRETLCAGLNNHRGGMIGAHRDGGYAEFVAVPARNLLVMPEGVSFEQACLIPNTIGPVVKACSARARIRAGEDVLIIGAGGGMGLHAIQAARACGARVIAAIRSPRTAQACAASGADVVISTRDHDLAQEARRLTEGWGVDAVLDFVANRETLQASIAALAPGARLVIMGYFPRGGILETLTWPFTEEIEVTGNRSAGRQDIAQCLALIQNGRIAPVIGRTFALKDAVAAHKAFEAGEIVGRAVLVV
ncbi:MAG: zinc-binding dehydrogenase [Burkholderiales bacterium]|nr:zinc-binding dehydrogenase [Burkholderiales bacterium]